jgi:hypothetical protein
LNSGWKEEHVKRMRGPAKKRKTLADGKKTTKRFEKERTIATTKKRMRKVAQREGHDDCNILPQENNRDKDLTGRRARGKRREEI